MRELLYLTAVNPPEQILNHSILYRDSISTIDVPGSDAILFEKTKIARDAGILRVREVQEIFESDPAYGKSDNPWKDSTSKAIEVFTDLFAGTPEIGESIEINFGPALSASQTQKVAKLLRPVLFGDGRHLQDGGDPGLDLANAILRVALRTSAALSLERRSQLDSGAPVMIVCHEDGFSGALRESINALHKKHLYARIDVGGFLPEPPAGVDARAVIAFRERYEDERKRLIRAVEGLIKQAAGNHGRHGLADIGREVHEELNAALEDLKRAGRRSFGGWARRAAWVTVASIAGAAAAGPIGAAAGSVAANWASNPVPRSGKVGEYAYLYRIHNELDDFSRRTT